MIGALIGIAFLIGFLGGWPAIPLATAGIVLFALATSRHWPLIPLIVVASTLGAWRAPEAANVPEAPTLAIGSRVEGVVTSAVVDDGRVQRFKFADDDWTICARTFARSDIGRGDRLLAEVDIAEPEFVSTGYRQYLRSQGCGASGTLGSITLARQGNGITRWIDEVRQSVTRRVVSWVPGDRGALLAGLVIGDDALMSDDATDAFARTGTIHVVAVSGSNLALLASLLLVTNILFTRRILSEATGLAIIWSYVLIGGAVPPTLRAGMLATAAAGSRLVGRPADVLTLSIQVAAVQAALWPHATLGLSYRLSTVAIFGVVIAAAGRSFKGWLSGIRLVAMTTVVVNVAMLPILPAESRPILLLSLLTNVAIAPLIALAFTLGVLAVAVGWLISPLGQATAVVAGEINGLTLSIVMRMAEIDQLPGPLDASGSSAPGWLLIGIAIVFLAAVSSEFRRWLRDMHRRGAVVSLDAANVALGAGLGVFCATVGIVLLR